MRNLDVLRDELAQLLGYRPVGPNNRIGHSHWIDSRGDVFIDPDGFTAHPVPASLDTIASIWAERLKGYSWWRMRGYWFAYRVDDGTIVDQSPVRIPDTGNELHDRTTLTIACTGPCNSKGIHMRPDGITECSYMAAPQRTKPVEQVPASEPYPTNVVKVWQSKTTRWWLFDDGSVQCASIGSNAWFRANTTLAQLEACRCDTGDPVKLIYARESKPSEPPARTVEQEAEKWAERMVTHAVNGTEYLQSLDGSKASPFLNQSDGADLCAFRRGIIRDALTTFAQQHATELQAKLSKANERVEAQARVIEEAQARVIEAWEDLHRKGHMEWNTCWAILGDAKSQLSKLEGT